MQDIPTQNQTNIQKAVAGSNYQRGVLRKPVRVNSLLQGYKAESTGGVVILFVYCILCYIMVVCVTLGLCNYTQVMQKSKLLSCFVFPHHQK